MVLLDSLLSIGPRELLQAPEKSFGPVLSSQRVGDGGAANIAEPAKKKDRERRAMRAVGEEASKRNYCVRREWREEIFEGGKHGDGGVQRAQRKIAEPSRD